MTSPTLLPPKLLRYECNKAFPSRGVGEGGWMVRRGVTRGENPVRRSIITKELGGHTDADGRRCVVTVQHNRLVAYLSSWH